MHLDDFPDGVVVAGADGVVEYVNDRIERMARAAPGEMLGMHLADAMPFDDLNGNSWYDCTRPYDGMHIRNRLSEQSWYSPRGSEYLVTARLVRERPGGPIIRVVACVRNAKVRNQRDRERSDLVATVAHELRSPLTGIKGFTSTLLSKWDRFTEAQRQFMLETVDSDADRLSRLITELLDAARIDAGRLTLRRGPVKLEEVVQSVLRSVSGGGEPFELETRGEPYLVWGDPDRMTQVATNLVENALRHGHGLARVVVEHLDDAQGAVLEVHDQGPGIPEQMRQRVFSRFWRSGPGAGSGLGMYIVRGIVEEHGGRIDIGEADGGGALIRVWLPVNEPDGLSD